ncbi:MAG: CdvA-like protein [Candidatus Bathyarchaeota archaeon]|nr:CdvA-like protein [Candidatus Bathyarchaeota archaeon]MDH5787070.1 CdvA-like protein [Candidatus Bathyarchaeota archaeon]
MSQNPNFFLSIGKPIKDEYGRTIGKIASFAVNPNGKFDAAFIEQGDGKFLKLSTERLKFDGADVTLIHTIKSGANAFCDQIPVIWRKDQALKDLVEKRKISQELYEELHNNFDGVLTQLKTEAQTLLEALDKEIVRCSKETRELNYALVHLELEHEIGKVDSQSYEEAFTIIQENLKRVNTERGDLELTKSKLSNILLGEERNTTEQETTEQEKNEVAEDSSKEPASASPSPELPEPPVVVYVKEVGKSGI